MKKIILLIFMLLTVGCTAKYDLTIDGENVTESLSLSSEESDISSKEYYYADYLNEYPVFEDEEFLYYAPTEKIEGVQYYTKSIIETGYGYDANYKATFEFDDLKRSRLLNNTFINFNIGYDRSNDYYYIVAQNIKLFDYDNNITNLEININIGDFEIVENNANSINGNTLSWNFIKSENNESDRIILKYREKIEEPTTPSEPDDDEIVEEPTNNEVSLDDILLVVCSLFIFILVLIVIIFVSKKTRK